MALLDRSASDSVAVTDVASGLFVQEIVILDATINAICVITGAGTGGGGDPPVITNVVPTPGPVFTRTSGFTFSVTDDLGQLKRVMVFASEGIRDIIVFQSEDITAPVNVDFAVGFRDSSTATVVAGPPAGIDFVIFPDAFWETEPTFTILAYDNAGQEAVVVV